jgi:general secretion pathway protein D
MGLLLVSDYPRNIANMKKLIKLFDTHLKQDLRRVPFTYYNVKTALPKLKSIFAATKENYKSDIKLMSDEYQNTLWVSANSEDMAKVVAFIKDYDEQAKDVAMMQTKILFLENANVAHILKTAKEIAKSKDANKPIKSVITANKELNALIISSTANQIKELTKLIHKIDIQRKQVFIKVQIFEVSQNKLDQLGVKWGAAAGGVSNGLLATASINMGGSAFSLPSSIASSIDLGKVDATVALGATVDFLKNEGAINVISEPNLLSINNLKSTIYVGKTQSIKTGDSTGANALDTTRNTYKREDIGLTLEITPQITDKNSVALKIMINYENVDKAESVSVDQPTTTKRKVNTVAIVQNESSITLGGLIRTTFSKSESKVPVLGDIPFLGLMFRHEATSFDQISTIMVLTPYIVNNSLELVELQKKLTTTKSIEQRMARQMAEAIKRAEKNEEYENNVTF